MTTFYEQATVYCVICATEIPLDRKKKRSVTCSVFCAKVRNNWLRERKELKHCKYCGNPSTPEERDEFRAWRRERKQMTQRTAGGTVEAPQGSGVRG